MHAFPNNKPEIAGSESEIDMLISTDVLLEGQNLQDCGILINIDELLAAVKSISTAIEPPDGSNTPNLESKSPVKREDLKLVCFDYVWQ